MLLKNKKRSSLTKEEKSWILYDAGNSAFSLVIITAVMPIFFKDTASAGIPAEVSTANWGMANSAASLSLAVLAPLLGSLADRGKLKMKFLVGFMSMGAAFTFLFCLVGAGDWALCLWLYIFARIGWAGANLFYDSFIVDATTKERMDRVSAHGFAWGYIGSVAPFLIVIALLMSAEGESGFLSPELGAKIGFVVTGVWWLLFSPPLILNVKQRHFAPPSAYPGGFKSLVRTFGEIGKHKRAVTFLIAYFFYIDGVGTVISMAVAYGRDLGFGVSLLIVVILFIQIIAFPFSLVYGRLARTFSAKNMLMFGVAVYGVVAFVSFLLPSFSDETVRKAVFWFLAFLVGSSMGGVQALSRSYFAKLIPPERASEFFGFYNMFGKFAVVVGPLLMGTVGRLAGHSRWGVLSVLVLFVAGAWILSRVEDG